MDVKFIKFMKVTLNQFDTMQKASKKNNELDFQKNR